MKLAARVRVHIVSECRRLPDAFDTLRDVADIGPVQPRPRQRGDLGDAVEAGRVRWRRLIDDLGVWDLTDRRAGGDVDESPEIGQRSGDIKHVDRAAEI